MKKLLRIDSSARMEGSRSRELADYYQAHWLAANPGGQVVMRDLAREALPHLQNSTIAAFYTAGENTTDATALSDTLIGELKTADHVLISCPVYNFGIPSSLKAYVDHIVRSGHTFDYTSEGYAGRLRGKTACVITASGGSRGDNGFRDYAGPFLKTVLAFVGIETVQLVSLEGMAKGAPQRKESITRAQAEIDLLFGLSDGKNSEPQWLGEFTAQDRAEIGALRAGQAAAIERGDAQAYAALCAEDVHWMFPGREVVSSKEQFLASQAQLGQVNHVQTMRKFPLRVERAGQLAVEIGRQELTMAPGSPAAYVPRQKYTHIFRQTAEGWRFAVLMSNACP